MRSLLLPEGMSTEHWINLMDAIDSVWATRIDSKINSIRKLRHSLVPTSILGTDLQEFGTLDALDKETLVKKARQVGLTLTEADDIGIPALQRLVATIPRYWYSKGTVRLDNYLNYALNTTCVLRPLWTENYIDFYEKDSPFMGVSILEGGTWYPTSHLDLDIVSASLIDISKEGFLKVLYQLLPATAVLRRISLT